MDNHPLTSAQKQARRNSDLDAIAQAAGWPTWTRYATAVKRGVVSIEKKPKGEKKMNFEKIAKNVREDGEECTADDVKRLYDSLDLKNKKAATEKWMIDTLRNTQPPINS